MADPADFGTKIKELRLSRDWSIRKTSTALGISHYRLSEIEKNLSRTTGHPTRPTRELVLKMAATFGVPSDYLLDLAGYAREHPDLTDEDNLLLDIFHGLEPEKRSTAIKLLLVLAGQ